MWIDAASRSTVANYPYSVLACRAILEIRRRPIDERISNTDHVKICFATLGILSVWRN